MALRPCFVWGPRDTSVLPALRRMAEGGGLVCLGGGRAEVPTTQVHAVGCSLEHGRGGQAYFVADDGDTDNHSFIGGLAEADGLSSSGPRLPASVVRGAAAVAEGVCRLLGLQRPPPVTCMAAMLMSSDMTVISDKPEPSCTGP